MLYQGIEFDVGKVIELYLSKSCIKRVNKEIQLLEHYGTKNIRLTRQNSIIYLRFEINNLKFKIHVPINFPFRAPGYIEINDKNYREMLVFKNNKFINNELTKINIKCLCCTSKLCTNNWTPTIKIYNFIEEYQKNKKLILNLCNKYWFSKYCQENNIILEIEELILSFI